MEAHIQKQQAPGVLVQVEITEDDEKRKQHRHRRQQNRGNEPIIHTAAPPSFLEPGKQNRKRRKHG